MRWRASRWHPSQGQQKKAGPQESRQLYKDERAAFPRASDQQDSAVEQRWTARSRFTTRSVRGSKVRSRAGQVRLTSGGAAQTATVAGGGHSVPPPIA